MKVSELTGVKLDYWVAKAEGFADFVDKLVVGSVRLQHVADSEEMYCIIHTDRFQEGFLRGDEFYSPSTNWAQGGPIIEREKIELTCEVPEYGDVKVWMAYCDEHSSTNEPEGIGSTPLTAAMRAYVASKFGEEVPYEPQ